MRIFYFSDLVTVILCFVIWPAWELMAMKITFLVDDSFYNSENFLFKQRRFELDGRLYERVFKIKKWKELLPDGAALIKGGYRKKRLENGSFANLEKFYLETCRAEFTHVLGFLPFWLFGLFVPPGIVVVMFIYALMANWPCILLQRYNRIRLERVINRTKNPRNQ